MSKFELTGDFWRYSEYRNKERYKKVKYAEKHCFKYFNKERKYARSSLKAFFIRQFLT